MKPLRRKFKLLPFLRVASLTIVEKLKSGIIENRTRNHLMTKIYLKTDFTCQLIQQLHLLLFGKHLISASQMANGLPMTSKLLPV